MLNSRKTRNFQSCRIYLQTVTTMCIRDHCEFRRVQSYKVSANRHHSSASSRFRRDNCSAATHVKSATTETEYSNLNGAVTARRCENDGRKESIRNASNALLRLVHFVPKNIHLYFHPAIARHSMSKIASMTGISDSLNSSTMLHCEFGS